MFSRGIRLPFNLLGIPVFLDWSFLIILPLLAWLIGAQLALLAQRLGLEVTPALLEPLARFGIGLIAAIGLFTAVVLHELGHAVTARLYGVKVRSITLWFLGGVARFEDMPRQPGAEAVVAIVGPIVSVVLGALCAVVFLLIPEAAAGTRFIFAYLAIMNIVLAVFNMIPALPLDGGRVLRSLLALAMPHLRATQITGWISKTLAILLALFAILPPMFNPFLLIIAIFIYLAVSAETSMSQVEDLLYGAHVGDLMNYDVKTVPPDITVDELTRRMLDERHLGFPVVDDAGRIVGMITIGQIQGREPGHSVAHLMSREFPAVREQDDAIEAMRLMNNNDFSRIPVINEEGRLVGIITKTDLMHAIQLRAISREWTRPRVPQHPNQPWAEPVYRG